MHCSSAWMGRMGIAETISGVGHLYLYIVQTKGRFHSGMSWWHIGRCFRIMCYHQITTYGC
jgi:hypothetical protein